MIQNTIDSYLQTLELYLMLISLKTTTPPSSDYKGELL